MSPITDHLTMARDLRIVSYGDLVEEGSFAAARTAGKLRSEGNDYVMRDGDVVDFRFHV